MLIQFFRIPKLYLISVLSPFLMAKNLAVFDFDHTVINDNSDVAIMKLIENKIPSEVKELYRSDGWTSYMQAVFRILHQNNITENYIRKFIKKLSPTLGMCELITELKDKLNYDVIVLSDSNSYFIDAWLDEYKLKDKVFKVFTNPAYFDDSGLLNIKMYHMQDYCKLSTKNLCKGQIMEDFIEMQEDNDVLYEKIVYIGDGWNDFCPILRLKQKDLACVREKYKCAEIVTKAKESEYMGEDGIPHKVLSDVLVWKTGFDILDYLKKRPKYEYFIKV